MNRQGKNKIPYWIGVIFVLLAFIVPSVNAYASPTGSLTVRKFAVENYENLKEATGQESDSGDIPSGAKTIEEVSFTLEKLLVGSGDVTVTTSTPVDPSFPKVRQTTDADGETIFSDLPEGYYLVTEEIPSGFDALRSGAFVIRIPMKITDEQGNKSDLYDVTFYPKNREIKVEKVLTSERVVVGVGDIVSWKVDYPVGSDLKKEDTGTIHYAKDFYITDDMDRRLDYVPGSASLRFFNRERMAVPGFMMNEGVDYHITYDANTHTLRIDFTDGVGTNKVADAEIVTIELTISTRINETAIANATTITNNAKIEYTNASGDPYVHEVFPEGTSPEDSRVPKVYPGEIDITVVNQAGEKPIAGVVFALAATQEDARNGIFMTREVDGRQEIITVTTDVSGRAKITGVGEGTYYLMETETPEGFIPLTTPIQVTIGNDAHSKVAYMTIKKTEIGGEPEPTISVTPTPTISITPTPTPTGTQSPGSDNDKGTPKGTQSSGSDNGKGTSVGAKTGDIASIAGLIVLGTASIGIILGIMKIRRTKA